MCVSIGSGLQVDHGAKWQVPQCRKVSPQRKLIMSGMQSELQNTSTRRRVARKVHVRRAVDQKRRVGSRPSSDRVGVDAQRPLRSLSTL